MNKNRNRTVDVQLGDVVFLDLRGIPRELRGEARGTWLMDKGRYFVVIGILRGFVSLAALSTKPCGASGEPNLEIPPEARHGVDVFCEGPSYATPWVLQLSLRHVTAARSRDWSVGRYRTRVEPWMLERILRFVSTTCAA